MCAACPSTAHSAGIGLRTHQGESAGTGKRDPRTSRCGRRSNRASCRGLLRGSGAAGMASGMLGDGHRRCWSAIRYPLRWNGSHLPHHENEIAQARGAGDGFANYWLHNGWVTLAGEKMSKSIGNVVSMPAMLGKVRPVELRYYLGSAHYRSMLEYSGRRARRGRGRIPAHRVVPAPGGRAGRRGQGR